MYEIDIIDPSNIYNHFLELIAPHFPSRNFVVDQKNGTLNLTFKIQAPNPILTIYLLSVQSYDTYKQIGRSRLVHYLNASQQKQTLILYFPSLLRVDEKLNKIFLQTYDLIQADLFQLKSIPKEKVQKIIFYDPDKELNKENCVKEFLNCLKVYLAGLLEFEIDKINDQIEEMHTYQQEKGFSYYKIFSLNEKKAQLYINLNLKQDALEIYSKFENYFLSTYPQQTRSTFSLIHPFDFLTKRTIEQNLSNLEEYGEETLCPVIEFLSIVQYRIIDLLSLYNQSACFERIVDFVEQINQVVQLAIDNMKSKNQFMEGEEQLWQLGTLIWNYFNIQTHLSLMSQVPQNLVGQPLVSYYLSNLKVRRKLIGLVEEIGYQLYDIQFNKIRRMPILEQCELLEQQLQGSISNQLSNVPNKEILRTYLLSDTKLRGQIEELPLFIKLFNEKVSDYISICDLLKSDRQAFEAKLMIVKLKNYYPQLDLIPIDHFNSYPQLKHLHTSYLVQQLIQMHRENMQISFQECFNEVLVSELPGQCFTKLFKILELPLTKLKFVFFGYFEQFIVLQRISFDEYEFRVTIMKYLNIECDGKLEITLKSRNHEKKKIKLSTNVEFRDIKKPNFTFRQQISIGCSYQIKKAVLFSGPFKLYFDVSQKIQHLKLNLMYPNIEIAGSEVSSVGTALPLIVRDINASQIEINIQTHLKMGLQMIGGDIKQLEDKRFVVNFSEPVIEKELTLLAVGFDDTEPMLVKMQVVSQNNQEFVYDTKLQIANDIELEDMSDQVDDEYQLYQISSRSRKNYILSNGQMVSYGDCLRVYTKQEIKIIEENKQFGFSLQEILNIKKSILQIHDLERRQLIFKILIITVFQQEHCTPYRQPEYFNVIMKLHYLGQDENQFSITLKSYNVKGKRTFSEIFSKEKTICVKDFQCFVSGSSDDFEKPNISILMNDRKLNQNSLDIEFQLQIDDLQQ